MLRAEATASLSQKPLAGPAVGHVLVQHQAAVVTQAVHETTLPTVAAEAGGGIRPRLRSWGADQLVLSCQLGLALTAGESELLVPYCGTKTASFAGP